MMDDREARLQPEFFVREMGADVVLRSETSHTSLFYRITLVRRALVIPNMVDRVRILRLC
jgi:hypothetical protein